MNGKVKGKREEKALGSRPPFCLLPFSFYLLLVFPVVSRCSVMPGPSSAASAVAAVSCVSGWSFASAVARAVGEDQARRAECKYEG